MSKYNFILILMFLFMSGCKDAQKVASKESADSYSLKIIEKSLSNNTIKIKIEKNRKEKIIQVFIDSDLDANTGYNNQIVSGADYLLEEERIYKAKANGSKWNWEEIGVSEFINNDNAIYLKVTKDFMPQIDKNFRAGVVSLSADWENISYIEMAPLEDKKALIISEVMAVNAHTKMDPDFFAFSDWIEIHNQSNSEIDISNYMLSDNLKKGKWTIPKNTTISPQEFLIFWADEEDTVKNGFHTNFKLKSKGDAVALFDIDANLVDGFKFSKQEADVSYGISGYMSPTPKEKNSASIKNLTLSLEPIFSTKGGFYYQTQYISLSSENEASIYYTTDGSLPDKNSAVYTDQLIADKTMIIRARSFKEGKLLSSTKTQSYFINEETTLPVISIVTDSKYFFDNEIGIYTIGTNGAPTPQCTKGPSVANFYQSWKRPVNIEYFDKDKKLGFSQVLDIKISGSCSRIIAQKSFSVKANSKYGKKSIDYKLFPNKNINKFKGFKIKSAGQDWYGTMLRDAFMQQVIKDDMDVDYQDYRPSVVFINGKYWGIHNIREKKNEDFLAENHPALDDKKVNILQDNTFENEGSNIEYEKMLTFIRENTLADNQNYNEVLAKIDVENYIDYIIAETYFANTDWPYTNVRYWSEQKAGSKWRWILEDLDLGLGAWDDLINTNRLSFLTATVNLDTKNPLWSTFLFRSLLENSNFKSRFKQKYSNYLNSTFNENRILGILDNLTDAIKDEIPRHVTRWKDSDKDMFNSLQDWEGNVEHLKDVIRGRNDTVRNELESF